MTRIGILAGGGRLPLMIAESVIQRGGQVHIVAVEGEAGPEIERFPHTWVNWGQVGRIISTLRSEGGGVLVIAGGVTRPDLYKLKPDLGFFRVLPQLVRMLTGGDDSVLTRVVRVIESQGLVVRGAHEVAPDLIAQAGPMGHIELDATGLADAQLGFAVRRALGSLDVGQAVVARNGRVLAIEGAEGTDAVLERVARLPSGLTGVRAAGVLSKGPKPGQELRVDMPAIGPRTVAAAVAAGLAGIAVEAGAVLVLDRAEVVAAADAAGCALLGLSPSPRTAQAAAIATPRRARVAGRRRPGRRDETDIEKGLAVVTALAPFATGASAFVSRAYVLAVEAEEGVSALLSRVGALRQWGLGRGGRRAGVLVRRLDGDTTTGLAPQALFGEAVAQGLAGIAVAGSARAVEPYLAAARHADSLGLFLVVCDAIGETRGGRS
jgi:UDP-2,3-diacylglucosamine hydrolase